MQVAKKRIGMDDIHFTAAMARIGRWTANTGERIRYTGTVARSRPRSDGP
jgi:hypothetical protein